MATLSRLPCYMCYYVRCFFISSVS